MPQSISFQGCSLSFGEQGSGEPVVFIQGVGLHREGWRPQIDVLQAAYRCVTRQRSWRRSSGTISPYHRRE
jgi:hypothetical protein